MPELLFPPNRLARETSPYLLQHAHNPVDWYPWGDEALEKARREDKPIFLSIGYAACHWCHVMERESFMDERVAAFLNEHFVAVKVDREERPDLDNIYMNAVVLMTGQGGWPTSVFLTPDLEPFYGGTYFPDAPRHGLPSFRDLLQAIQQAWQQDRRNIRAVGAEISKNLQQNSLQAPAADQPIDPGLLEAARDALISTYDWQNGGWGRAPKFPQPMLLEFLCLQASRGHSQSLELVRHALDVMQRGGIFDLVGGGFHRYSTDANWLVPHFEKMLYDNAQLALVYLHAYLLNGDVSYRSTCEGCLDFITREMSHPSGGFYSSLDADSNGEEGAFYIWREAELAELLTAEQLELLSAACPIPPGGNFDGRIILRLRAYRLEIADGLEITLEELNSKLSEIFARLRAARALRPRPPSDDKVLTGWNALALRAFAEAARYLGRADYLKTAQTNANFLLTELVRPQGLFRSWRSSQARHLAYLEDYAALATALVTLYQADFDQRWYAAAGALLSEMQQRFTDPSGGYFDTQAGAANLLFRPKEVQDNATPSGNSLAAYAALLYASFSGEGELRKSAERQIMQMQATLARYPSAFGCWLQALDFSLGPVRQIALISPQEYSAPNPLLEYLSSTFLPRTVLAAGQAPVSVGTPYLLRDRSPIDGLPTAFVCQDFTCRLPITKLEHLTAQLSGSLRESGRPAG